MLLLIHENELYYEGTFAKPAFTLWGEGKVVFEGLYGAFESFGVRLADLTIDSPSDQPALQEVRASIPSYGVFSFKFDRVELRGSGVTDAQLLQWPVLLERGTSWIQEGTKGALFASHVVVYTAHGSVTGATSTDILGRLPARTLGNTPSIPSGVIAHFQIPGLDAQGHLTVDHSVRVPNGIYVQFIVFLQRDRIVYSEVLSKARVALEQGLSSLDIVLPREGQQ